MMLESFIYRAVIGPAGLVTNSIAQGMLFLFLCEESQLRVGQVAFKQCANSECQRRYEGETCPYCQTPFRSEATPVLGVDWLVVEGERGYLPVSHWACGPRSRKHFYSQNLCREVIEQAFPEVRTGTVHGVKHDACPWQGCPHYSEKHGQRGTTLWIRAQYLGLAGNVIIGTRRSLPYLMEGITEGVQQAAERVTGWKRSLLHLLGDNEIAIVESLCVDDESIPSAVELSRALSGEPETPSPQVIRRVLDAEIRPIVIQAIRHALEQRGIDAETIKDYFSVELDIEIKRGEEVRDDEPKFDS